MDDFQLQIQSLLAKSAEITSTVANIRPSPTPPQLGPLDTEPVDPVHSPSRISFSASFPVTFSDGTQWVINFPLPSRTHPALLPLSLGAEAGVLYWARRHTTLPIPSIYGVDLEGNQSWNLTRHPCIVMDRMPGKHITNDRWERMTLEQQFLVVSHVARIKAELSIHPFTRIGSLYHPRAGRYKIGSLVSQAMNSYYFVHGPPHRDLFEASNSPYPSAKEYFGDMANKRLMHEAIQCEELSDRYTEFWIYRSLVPSLVPDDFNRGPFVVGHGHLDRSAILVNDNFELTGVINWEWSMTEPLQVAAIIPPFLAHIPNFDPGSELCRQFYGHYINALKAYERHFRSIQLPGTKLAPVISDLVRHGVIFQFIGSVARCADLDMSESLWMNVFSPTFGEIDRALFMDMFRNAPGVLDEFKRTRAFLQQREVHP